MVKINSNNSVAPGFLFTIIGFSLGIIFGLLSSFIDFYPGTHNYLVSYSLLTVFWALIFVGIVVLNKEEIEELRTQGIRIYYYCGTWIKSYWERLVIWLLLTVVLSPFAIFGLFLYSGDWVFSFSIGASILWALGYSFIVKEWEPKSSSKDSKEDGFFILKRTDELRWDEDELPRPCIHCGTINNPDAGRCVLCGLPPFEEIKN